MEKILKILPPLYGITLALIIFNAVLITIPKTLTPKSPLGEGFTVLGAKADYVDHDHIVFGFLPYWKLEAADYIRTESLTDIAYFALSIEKNGEIRTIGEDGNIDPGYNNWKNNPKLDQLIAQAARTGTRVSLTIISHETDITNSFLMCESCWPTLKNEMIAELKAKNIKDVNFDFEYAEYVDEKYADQYTKLVAYIHNELDKEFTDSFVTVSTFADSNIRPRVTKPDDLAEVADALFVMAYDFHQPNSDNAGPVAPIEGAGIYSEYDLETMMDDYTKNVPGYKLILGVPYYGYNWVVTADEEYAERIPGNDYHGYSISQSYEAVMDTILETNTAIKWDQLAKVPYFSYVSPSTGAQRIVYFENADSLKAKYDLAKYHRFAGVGIWALAYDGGYQELWELLEAEFD